MQRLKILVLGGTTEASALARMLADDQRFEAVLSFAGRTRALVPPPIAFRVGGFGGTSGLIRYLAEHRIDSLVDATHPFAVQISRHAAEAARTADMPLLVVRRPAWRPVPGDRWITVADMAAAADAVGVAPRRVFLTIGQKELQPFVDRPQHAYVIRSVDPPPAASRPANALVIAARGPFQEADERCLLRKHRIDIVVTKNSGGVATAAKLAAARSLGLPVVMVERPVMPGAPDVPDAAAAMAWLAARHDEARSIRRGV